ncbi:hypothetical protein DOM21_14760 [Bacteriovorax stolpii]|uniref:protein NO VEIN domain-containing protein n=1 Tax=Bacteriovorax stolpii TaxID=960 RepID=UPI00115B440C|nr:DUF3883 domain-containing protein [Bacteriovorax stolpii]QDK42687.1 hypothetical protein DOM21_14760 [Bacteriovorax stolpii]
MNKKVIMLNISWMKEYNGNQPGYDVPVNGGKYPKLNSVAGEEHNYTNVGDYFYGHVETLDSNINIERLGAPKGASELTGVLIIWIATPAGGGRQVVGWWKNATVYKKRQKPPKKNAEYILRNGFSYITKAKIKNCVLLLPIEREKYPFSFPDHEKKNWPGQSSRFYPFIQSKKSIQFENYFSDLMNVISKYKHIEAKKTNKAPFKAKKGRSAFHLSRIENAAVDFIISYYRKKYMPYEIIDVSNENKGWDLEIYLDKSGKSINVEAKGLSATLPMIGLTPNEYNYFKSKNIEYRLFIVTNCLKRRIGYEIMWDGIEWKIHKVNGELKVVRSKLQLKIKEIMSAYIKLE